MGWTKSKFYYCHPGCSPGGRYITSDGCRCVHKKLPFPLTTFFYCDFSNVFTHMHHLKVQCAEFWNPASIPWLNPYNCAVIPLLKSIAGPDLNSMMLIMERQEEHSCSIYNTVCFIRVEIDFPSYSFILVFTPHVRTQAVTEWGKSKKMASRSSVGALLCAPVLAMLIIILRASPFVCWNISITEQRSCSITPAITLRSRWTEKPFVC